MNNSNKKRRKGQHYLPYEIHDVKISWTPSIFSTTNKPDKNRIYYPQSSKKANHCNEPIADSQVEYEKFLKYDDMKRSLYNISIECW